MDLEQGAIMTRMEETRIRFHVRCSMRKDRTLKEIQERVAGDHGYRDEVRALVIEEYADPSSPL